MKARTVITKCQTRERDTMAEVVLTPYEALTMAQNLISAAQDAILNDDKNVSVVIPATVTQEDD